MLWNNWISNMQHFPILSRVRKLRKNLKWYLAHKTSLLPHGVFYSLRADDISHRSSLMLLFAQHQEIFRRCLYSQLVKIAFFSSPDVLPTTPQFWSGILERQSFWTKKPHRASNLDDDKWTVKLREPGVQPRNSERFPYRANRFKPGTLVPCQSKQGIIMVLMS